MKIFAIVWIGSLLFIGVALSLVGGYMWFLRDFLGLSLEYATVLVFVTATGITAAIAGYCGRNE